MHANHSQSPGAGAKARRSSQDFVAGEGDMEELSMSQRTLERAVNALTVDVTIKFQEMIDMQKDLKAMIASEGRTQHQHQQRSDVIPSPMRGVVRSVSRSKIDSALERRKQSMSSLSSVVSGMRSRVHPREGEGEQDIEEHSNQGE
jgi:hypothetical protein